MGTGGMLPPEKAFIRRKPQDPLATEKLCETTRYVINLLYLATEVSKEQRKQHRDTDPVHQRTSHSCFCKSLKWRNTTSLRQDFLGQWKARRIPCLD